MIHKQTHADAAAVLYYAEMASPIGPLISSDWITESRPSRWRS